MTSSFKLNAKFDEIVNTMFNEATKNELLKSEKTFEEQAKALADAKTAAPVEANKALVKARDEAIATATALEDGDDNGDEAAKKLFADKKAAMDAAQALPTEVAGEELTKLEEEATAKVELSPLFVFRQAVDAAKATLLATDKDTTGKYASTAVEAFKKSFAAAQTECVNAYKAQGKPTVGEYIQNFAMRLLAALVAIVLVPATYALGKEETRKNFYDNYLFAQPRTPNSIAAGKAVELDTDTLFEEEKEAASANTLK
ncbi:MAG: hypothetical protein P1U61_05475 [Legionellaceae bacterium]|nr:hypothetical protein [Legionellaceae bacterium]